MKQLYAYISEHYDKPLVWSYSGRCDTRCGVGRLELGNSRTFGPIIVINFIVLYEKNNSFYIDLLVFYEYIFDVHYYCYNSFIDKYNMTVTTELNDEHGHTADVFETIEINDKPFLAFDKISKKYEIWPLCVEVCEATNCDELKCNNDGHQLFTFIYSDGTEGYCDETDINTINDKHYYCQVLDDNFNIYFANEDVKHKMVNEFCKSLTAGLIPPMLCV
jgi:hypothetical protein